MNLFLEKAFAKGFRNSSQRTRVLTEGWVAKQAYCPCCGNPQLTRLPNNTPASDFCCAKCREFYELKSINGLFPGVINDGAYSSLMTSLKSKNNPSLFLLSYEQTPRSVMDFLVVPKHFFSPEIIRKRNPLRSTARRAGWIGCNILFRDIPQSGKISIVKNKKICEKKDVLVQWRALSFIQERVSVIDRGWLFDVLKCVEEIYQFEEKLKLKHPDNQHVKAKIRQQLQRLRDNGCLTFKGNGRYIYHVPGI